MLLEKSISTLANISWVEENTFFHLRVACCGVQLGLKMSEMLLKDRNSKATDTQRVGTVDQC